MISEIHIGNFKAFGPTQRIPLRPITLVFGPNSAGKSSIIQSLLLARHIHDTRNADAHQTTLGGAAVDLGGFMKYVRNHKGELKTTVQFVFNRFEVGTQFHYLDKFQTLRVAYDIGRAASSQPSSEVGIQSVTLWLDDCELVHLAMAASGELQVEQTALSERSLFSLKHLWKPYDFQRWHSGVGEPEVFGSSVRQYRDAIIRELGNIKFGATLGVFDNLGDLVRGSPNDDPDDTQEGNPFRYYKRFLEGVEDDFGGLENPERDARAWAMALRYDLECLTEAAGDAVQQVLRSISYLGPLRWIPPRLIPDGQQFDASWAAGGGHAWQRLRREPELLGRVNRFLQETLQSGYRLKCQRLAPELDVQKIELCVKRALESSASVPNLAAALQSELCAQTSGEGLTEISIVDAASGLAVSHRDVGTGISQLLPVLVNSAGGKNQLISIEQPELHLHPVLQAELGDVFIKSIRENNNTFLIETHSEHLILRLLRRIRETAANELPPGAPALKPDELSVLYVKPGKDGSEVIVLPVNIEGDFDTPWPDGFFPERAKELF